MHTISSEIVIPPLFTVGDNRRLDDYGDRRDVNHTDRCLDPTELFTALLQMGAPREAGSDGGDHRAGRDPRRTDRTRAVSVVVTGGAGTIGSHLVDQLVLEGAGEIQAQVIARRLLDRAN